MIKEIGEVVVGVIPVGMFVGLLILLSWLSAESPHTYGIHCYSKGELVFERQIFGYANAKYASEGWRFKDVETNRVTQVTGDCVVDELP